MRQRKFRIWDNIGKKMIYADEAKDMYNVLAIGLHGLPIIVDQDSFKKGQICAWNIEHNRFLMDWTGFKDKNEKEIYEDDIVKFHYFYQSLGANLGAQESEHELIGVIEMGTYGWAVTAIRGEHWQGYTGYGSGEGESNLMELCSMNESSLHEESFEVIGNRYENPGLLTT
jgi:uncharacterized phage protein (TIGR01671 family)